jgi:hypothetical protein
MMEFKLKCVICGKELTNKNQYIATHLKRKHNIDFYDYISKYYIQTNNTIIEKCGFCNNPAIPNYVIDNINKTYTINYDNGYLCKTNECKEKISQYILGTSYNKKTFEHIGSKSEYLSKIFKISIDESKKLKYEQNRKILDNQKSDLNGFKLRFGDVEGEKKYNERCEKISKSKNKDWYINNYGTIEGLKKWENYLSKLNPSLNSYINKYGDVEGEKKYKERCEKISKSSNKDWYINKYGDVEGEKRWNSYTNKIRLNNRKNKSKKSKKISIILNNISIEYFDEYKISDLNYYCDYYIEKYNTIIEYYGDYWHCNPIFYNKNYYHQYINLTANEIWEKDKKRIDKIYSYYNNNINIIIIWESTKINNELLYKILEDNKNKNNILYV